MPTSGPEHPFSNGTEGREWMRIWCDECECDHGMHDESLGQDGCAIVLQALIHEPVKEWTDYSDVHGFTLPASMTCSAFSFPSRACSPMMVLA